MHANVIRITAPLIRRFQNDISFCYKKNLLVKKFFQLFILHNAVLFILFAYISLTKNGLPARIDPCKKSWDNFFADAYPGLLQ